MEVASPTVGTDTPGTDMDTMVMVDGTVDRITAITTTITADTAGTVDTPEVASATAGLESTVLFLCTEVTRPATGLG